MNISAAQSLSKYWRYIAYCLLTFEAPKTKPDDWQFHLLPGCRTLQGCLFAKNIISHRVLFVSQFAVRSILRQRPDIFIMHGSFTDV